MKPPAKATRVSKAVLTGEIATTHDGRDITRPWIHGLQQPRDPRLLGSVDWGVYDRIHEDDQVMSTFQQRRRAVISHSWSVLPGQDDDARAVEAAERFGETIDRLGWDRISDKMLFAILNGISIAEVIWESRGGLIDIGEIRVRHARRFRFDADNRLRLLTTAGGFGEVMPDRKFWVLTMGGSDDDERYGRGLAEWLYWPTLFKRNGIRFWNIFLDKFGSPTALGKFRPGTSQADINKLLGALQAIATDSGIAVPEGMAIELLGVARSGTADFEKLVRYMDEAIAKVVLSQTMTTQDGSSLSQAQVHAGVKLEVIKADADLLSDSFNGSVARWWTDLNYGPDVPSPRLMREVEEEADTKAQAETDTALKQLGWERTDESFTDTYGEGYVRVKAAKPEAPDDGDADPDAGADPDGEGDDDAPPDPNVNDRASFAADDPRPLYVYRRLLNADELLAWARGQGFTTLMPADELHVTVMYSKRPVNWLRMGGFHGWNGDNAEHIVPKGGPRIVDRIGDQGAVALHFFSGHLEQRNREMRNSGASWDYADYVPHVTLTYDAGDIDLKSIEPYTGELRFGPEVFEPIQQDWEERVRAASFAEAAIPDSATDSLVDDLIAADGYRAVRQLTDPMLAAIRAAKTPDELVKLLAANPGDDLGIAADIERAGLAAALDAEEGDLAS